MGWVAGMVVGLKGLLVVYTQQEKSGVRRGDENLREVYMYVCVLGGEKVQNGE